MKHLANIEYVGNFPTSEMDLTTFVVNGIEKKVEEVGELQTARQFFPYKKEYFTNPIKEGLKPPMVSGIMKLDIQLELRRNVGLDDVKYYKDRWMKATSNGKNITVQTFGSEEFRQLYIHYQAVVDTWLLENGQVKNYKMGYYIDPKKGINDQPETILKQILQGIEKYASKYPYLVFSMTGKAPKKGAFPYAVIQFGKYDEKKNIVGVPEALYTKLPVAGQAPISMEDVGVFPTEATSEIKADDESFPEE